MNDPMAGLRERFKARAATHVADLERAIDDGDDAAIRHLAHKLAGSAAMFGFAELGALAQEIEAQADEGAPVRDLPAVGQLLAGLRAIAHDAD